MRPIDSPAKVFAISSQVASASSPEGDHSIVKDKSQATMSAMINVNGAHQTFQAGESDGQH